MGAAGYIKISAYGIVYIIAYGTWSCLQMSKTKIRGYVPDSKRPLGTQWNDSAAVCYVTTIANMSGYFMHCLISLSSQRILSAT